MNSCCVDDNPLEPQPEKPVYEGTPLVILDTDIGSSTDDLFVMDMLYNYEQQNKLKVLGGVVNRNRGKRRTFSDINFDLSNK